MSRDGSDLCRLRLCAWSSSTALFGAGCVPDAPKIGPIVDEPKLQRSNQCLAIGRPLPLPKFHSEEHLPDSRAFDDDLTPNSSFSQCLTSDLAHLQPLLLRHRAISDCYVVYHHHYYRWCCICVGEKSVRGGCLSRVVLRFFSIDCPVAHITGPLFLTNSARCLARQKRPF